MADSRFWALTLAASFCGAATTTAVRAAPPNVVILMADDMGWGDLGCYPKGKAWGEAAVTPTPNIDALAAAGVRCTQGYATGMVCAPSRAGLLTGRFQSRWGYYGFEDSVAPIPRDVTTLPEALRKAGYATAAIGKWHVSTESSSLPLQRGFDRFFGFLCGQHDYYYSAVGQTFHGVGYGPDGHVFDQDKPSTGTKYLTEEFTDRAIAFMDESARAGKPFLCYVPYNAPHTPHQVPWSDLAPYVAKDPTAKRPAPRDVVRAMIGNLDRNVGRLTAFLRERGLESNTIVVFTSDNGGSDGGPGAFTQHNGGLRGRKGTFYEGGVRVPFIVRWPGKLPAGVDFEEPVSHVDLYATALAAAGVATPADAVPFDGVDLAVRLTSTASPNRTLQWTMDGPDAAKWAVRDGDLKLLLDDTKPETMATDKANRVAERKIMLFDLRADPNETTDLAESRPADVARLRALHDAYIANCRPSLYTDDVKAAHRAALAARLADPALADVPIANGSPGHWIGAGGAGRANEEGVFPPLPATRPATGKAKKAQAAAAD